MLVYRITHQKYTGTFYASGTAGRFNSEGKKVIYTAGSISLAMLENLVHRNGAGFSDQFGIMVIYIPVEMDVTVIHKKDIPKDWNTTHNYAITQPLGDAWFDRQDTAVLKVPSAIVPLEFNYVLNSLHPLFNKIRIVQSLPFFADGRIDDLIEKYQDK